MKRFYLLFCCCFVFLCSSLYGHIVSVPDTCHLSYIVREDSVRSGQHIVDLACVQIDIVSTFVIDGTGSYEAIIGTNAGGRTDATNANQFYPTFSPVSPNVAAIERFGTHPVNLNTGLASVNIPIFEIKAGAITVPIGLSYHGGGIKVGDVASWVGTSWALNAGGNISRSLNGRPDEYLGSFLEKGVRSYFNPLNPATCEVDRGDLNRLLNNQLDSGGDLFNFTTPSGSGRFILVPQSTDVITIPSDKVKVSYTRSDRTYFSEFKVRDEGGLLYTFNDREFASSTTNGRVSASTTAWLLNRIEGHSPNQRVEFDYENTAMSYSSDYQESQVLTDRLTCNYQGGPSEGVGLIQSSEVYTDQSGKQLKEIRFPSGKVVFERSSQNREDLPNNQYLDHIKIYGFRPNTDDYVLIKSVDLDYDYYLNTDGSKRLFLTKVKLLNNDGSIESQYEMNYNTGVGLPGILSKARDWHGYYNGQTSNSTLIPTQTATAYYAGGTVPVTMGGANRETNATAMQAGILTRIKYPTGGYSDFEYEANQYLSNGTAKTTGGLRIAKIQTYSGAAALPMVKQYKYGIGEVGYGLLGTTIRPEFLSTTQKFKIEGGDNCAGGSQSYYQTVFTTNYNVSLLPFEGSPVYYSEVAEYEGTGATALGKTVYVFRDSRSDSIMYIPGPEPFKTKNGTISFHWDRGQQLEKRVYDQAGGLKYKQNTDYVYVHQGKTAFVYGLLVYHYFVNAFMAQFGTCSDYYPEYFYQPYQMSLGNLRPKLNREYFYENGNLTDYQYKATETDYSPVHYFPIETRSLVSGNEQLVQRFHYAQDYGSLSGSANADGWQRLIDRNRFTPIEELSLRKSSPSDGNPLVLGGKLTTYTVQNGEPVMDKVLSLEVGDGSLSQSGFGWATPSGGGLAFNQAYTQQVAITGYDPDNNPTDFVGRDGMNRHFDWQSYTLPTAAGAMRLSLLQTETQGYGSSVAQSTVYHYTVPLLGIDQRTEPSGRNSYFEYDTYGRLLRSKDHDGKVLGQYSYGYATGAGAANRVKTETPRQAMATVSGDYTQVQRSSQYFDGLGRATQSVTEQGAADGSKDVVMGATTFDLNGRNDKQYLPFPSTGVGGGAISDFQSPAQGFYGDANSFSQTEYEASPQSRPLKQFGAGQAWRVANKAQQISYANATNIMRFVATGTGISKIVYPAHDIVATTNTNEQGNVVIEYKDLEGRVVQKSVQESAGNYLTTAYCYDNFGRLKYVIPPKLYDWFGSNGSLSESQAEYQEGAFGYEYDKNGRQVSKQVPGGGLTEMVYDKFDRMALSRTALQASLGRWSFVKYDALNRAVMTGEKLETNNRQTLQTQADNASGHHEDRSADSPVYYSLSNSYPSASEAQLLSVSYFDDYLNWPNAGMAFDGGNAFYTDFGNATGLSTGARIRSEINNDWLCSVAYYDEKKRVVQAFAQNHKGGLDRTETQFSFIGEALQSRIIHQKTGQSPIVILEENQFDHQSRKTKTFHTYNGGSRVEIANYNYDAIGRLIQKKLRPDRTYQRFGNTPESIVRNSAPPANTEDIASKYICLLPGFTATPNYVAQIGAGVSTGTTQGLQTIDYGYHIRGGLKTINSGQLDNTQNDLFGYKLDYEDDGTYFDGNIRKQSWISKTGQQLRSFTFDYDASSRLKSGTYTGAGSENYSLENINYDKNGNIQTLIQNGFKGGGTFGQIDQLGYVYQQNNVGNKLQSVSDAVGGNVDVSDFRDRNTGIDYSYDASGNLTQDLNKEIVNISYNRLNLPIQIGLTNGRWIKYYYTANGKKLRKETSLGEAWDYVGGFVYRADTVYQVAQPEGRLIKVGGQMVYEFEYNDHLNNGRLSFRDSLAASQNGVYAPPVITQENGYLPFGNRMVGLDYEQSNKDYFNYLSKERQDDFGINLLHLEQRFYDAVKGRFDTQDPVTDGQESLSLYQYGWNNPVLKSDPNGDCPACAEWLRAQWKETKAWWNRPMSKELQEYYTLSANYPVNTNGDLMILTAGRSAEAMNQNGGRMRYWMGGKTKVSSITNKRLGPVGVVAGHHNANVRVVNNNGNTVRAERVVSGTMTAQEKALGFPLNTLASHTEARAVRNPENVELMQSPGSSMTITGQQAPCPSCKGKMNSLARETGNSILYQWRDNDVTNTWVTSQRPKND